jgi:predicted nuclease with TOPRIM domain
MPDLNEIHARMRVKKDEKKKVSQLVKDVFDQSKPYQEVMDELKRLKAKRLQLQNEIRAGLMSEVEQIDKLALDLQNDAMILSDLALTKLMQGETVEITDENDVKYQPVFKVSFKKA